MLTLQFPFENLTGPTPGSLRHGVAHLLADGQQGYWIQAIELFSQLPDRASQVLLPGCAKFDEVAGVLEAERSDDIAEALNERLRRGGYMALHGRNLPPNGLAPAWDRQAATTTAAA